MTLSVILKQLLHHNVILLPLKLSLLMTILTSLILFLAYLADDGPTFLASL